VGDRAECFYGHVCIRVSIALTSSKIGRWQGQKEKEGEGRRREGEGKRRERDGRRRRRGKERSGRKKWKKEGEGRRGRERE
jgi:hypothetical protein